MKSALVLKKLAQEIVKIREEYIRAYTEDHPGSVGPCQMDIKVDEQGWVTTSTFFSRGVGPGQDSFLSGS